METAVLLHNHLETNNFNSLSVREQPLIKNADENGDRDEENRQTSSGNQR